MVCSSYNIGNAIYKKVLDTKSVPHKGIDRSFFFGEKREGWQVWEIIYRGTKKDLGENLKNMGYKKLFCFFRLCDKNAAIESKNNVVPKPPRKTF